MSARPRMRVVAQVSAVEVVDGRCGLCRGRGRVGLFNGIDFALCFNCATSTAQLIASTRAPSARPHPRGCDCFPCVTFNEGQRGELAAPSVLRDGQVVSSSGDEPGRGFWLEVDD